MLELYLPVKLMACVSLGAIVYLAAVFGLWIIAGKREGAESYVVGLVKDFLTARRLLPWRNEA